MAYFEATEAGVHTGAPDVTVPDPYFGGEGPDRAGCNHCRACMTGCRVVAKNTLDRNYLHLAERRYCRVEADTEFGAVRPRSEGGFRIETPTPITRSVSSHRASAGSANRRRWRYTAQPPNHRFDSGGLTP